MLPRPMNPTLAELVVVVNARRRVLEIMVVVVLWCSVVMDDGMEEAASKSANLLNLVQLQIG
jgi:hypothetical protein